MHATSKKEFLEVISYTESHFLRQLLSHRVRSDTVAGV